MIEKKIMGITFLVVILVALYFSVIKISSALALQDWYFDALQNAQTSILWSLALGIILGTLICPTCSFPLTAYILGAESTAKNAFWASILFNTGRLSVFLMFGILAGLFGYFLAPELRMIAFGMVGVLMLLFAMELFDLIHLSQYISGGLTKHITLPLVSVNHPIELFIWGSLLGVVCSVNLIVPIATVWFGAITQNFFHAILVVLLFGIGAIIPPTIIAVIAGGSVEFTEKYMKSDVRKYARYIGGTILTFMGVQYLTGFALVLFG